MSPQTTLAIILGASEWPYAKLAGGPSFANSARAVREYLRDPRGLQLPESNLLDLFDKPGSPTDIMVMLADFFNARSREREFSDVFVYYVGHGDFWGSDNHYHLALRDTRTDFEEETSLRISILASRIKKGALFQRRFVILDSCFAGSALRSFQAGQAQVAVQKTANVLPRRGTLIYCSSNQNDPSLAPADQDYTMFSGALIECLRTGGPQLPAKLNMAEIDRLVWMSLRDRFGEDVAVRPELHCPDKREGDLSSLELFPNPARAPRSILLGESIHQHGSLSICSAGGGTLFLDDIEVKVLEEYEICPLPEIRAGRHRIKIVSEEFETVEETVLVRPNKHSALEFDPPLKGNVVKTIDQKSKASAHETGRGTLPSSSIDLTASHPVAQKSRLRELRAGEIDLIKVAGVEIEMVWCPPGEFIMGSPENEHERRDDETQHQVTLTKGFWLGQTAVTQGQWKAVMGDLLGELKARKDLLGDQKPVVYVFWDNAQVFIKKLNDMIPGGDYRLPTEAEWEYACRAGTRTRFSFGDRITTDQANYDGYYPPKGSPRGKYRQSTVAVKSLPANAWGLHEMHGNVWEWCQDRYGSYPRGGVVDPQGAEASEYRVVRGGSWMLNGWMVRSACRVRWEPGHRRASCGFRLARGQMV